MRWGWASYGLGAGPRLDMEAGLDFNLNSNALLIPLENMTSPTETLSNNASIAANVAVTPPSCSAAYVTKPYPL